MADTLKVNVTANEDFYDKGNARPRAKGETFVLRRDYAESLGKQVKIGDDVPDREPEKPEPQPQQKAGKEAKAGGEPLVEKVKPSSNQKQAAAPQGKDITMDNITTEGDEEPKKAKLPAKASAKKGTKK